ncbi:MAG: hypothetical protein AB9834_21090 [Lentimicrobium sp.]
MRRTLYVHLGMPKAGSTALQEFLYMNRVVLEKTGLLYPDPRELEQFSRDPQKMTGHHIVPMYLTGFFWAYFPKKEGVEAADVFRFIKKQIAESTAPKVLLSSEACWFMLNRQDIVNAFADAFSDFNLKVIVYLRRQDDHIQSGYNECIKSSFYTMTVDEFIEDRFLDPSNRYYTHLMLWVNAIGRENLLTRLYDKSCLINGSIFEDLLAQCEHEWVQKLRLPEKDANPRMSLNALMFQRCINLLFNDHITRKEFSKILMQWSTEDDEGSARAFVPHSLLTPGQRKKILNCYEPENKMLVKELLKPDEGLYFSREKASLHEQYPGLTLEKVVEIIRYIQSRQPELLHSLSKASNIYHSLSNTTSFQTGLIHEGLSVIKDTE